MEEVFSCWIDHFRTRCFQFREQIFEIK